MWNWSPQLEPPVCCCWPGVRRFYADVQEELDCADIIGELYPNPEDTVIEKYGYGAFYNTILPDRLRALDIEAVVITGTVTQICVDETARGAFNYGFIRPSPSPTRCLRSRPTCTPPRSRTWP